MQTFQQNYTKSIYSKKQPFCQYPAQIFGQKRFCRWVTAPKSRRHVRLTFCTKPVLSTARDAKYELYAQKTVHTVY